MEQSLSPTRRLPKSETTVTEILGAAAELFVERSYADVTMNQIAHQARLTKGAVYHHFASKEQVYEAMLRTELSRQGEIFAKSLDSARTCRESLRNLVSTFLALSPRERGVMRLLRRDVNIFSDPLRSELIRSYQHALPELIEPVMRRGMDDGELRPADPRLLSWQFVALVEVMLNPYAKRVIRSEDERIEYVIELFFHGAENVAAGDRP